MIDVVTVSSTDFGPASTNCCPMKIFKPSTLVFLAIAIAAALVTQPVRAVPIVNNIVITESSSTSLSATYNGLTTGVTVSFLGTDTWAVTFPSTVNFSQNGESTGPSQGALVSETW